MFDLIILCLVTAFILDKLFGILGRTDDGEVEKHRHKITILVDNVLKKKHDEEDSTNEIKVVDPEIISASEAMLSYNLKVIFKKIRAIESSFDIDKFLNGVRKAFSIIIGSLVKQDKDTLKELLSTDVYEYFSKQIDALVNKEHKLHCDVVYIRSLDIIDASIQNDKTALITVEIKSEQIKFISDSSNNIISGEEDKAVLKSDKWIFSKNLNCSEFVWKLSSVKAE